MGVAKAEPGFEVRGGAMDCELKAGEVGVCVCGGGA